MNTEEKKEISAEEKKKAEETLKERVPVQQANPQPEVTKKSVREAVKELNPDKDTLDRG